MADIRGIQLRQLQGRLSGIVYELTKVEHRCFPSVERWAPAINAYRCPQCILICVEPAGVEPGPT